MRVTKTADFGMRMVIHLAKMGEPQTLKGMAEELKISYHNLSKLVQLLSKAGIIQTKQGKNGGVTLLKSPEQITIRQLIDTIDGPTHLADCLVNEENCQFSCECKLKTALAGVQTKINQHLDEILISQLV